MHTLSADDLVRDTERAGCTAIRAVVEIVVEPVPPGGDGEVRRLLHGRGNPALPTMAEAARTALDPQDADRFAVALEDAVRAGRGTRRQAFVYPTAGVPGLPDQPASGGSSLES